MYNEKREGALYGIYEQIKSHSFTALTHTVDDGARKSNNWIDQWQSGKFSTGGRV